MALADKLSLINTEKLNIKQSLTDKGLDMTNIPFTEYHNKISELGGDLTVLHELKTTSTGYADSSHITVDKNTEVTVVASKVYRGTQNEAIHLYGVDDSGSPVLLKSQYTSNDAYGMLGAYWTVTGYSGYYLRGIQAGGTGSGCSFTFIY